MFITLDIHLTELFESLFRSIQAGDPERIVDDVFSLHSAEYRSEIRQYFTNIEVTRNIFERQENRRVLHIIPSYPLQDLTLPQIGVYLAGEESSDFVLGGDMGEAEPVMKGDEIVGWSQPEGYFATCQYRIDVIAGTRDEVIWLSRLCQRAIAGAILELDDIGVKEPKIGAADLQIPRELFPAMTFGRAISFSSKNVTTWKRASVGTGGAGKGSLTSADKYETGINTALGG